MKKEFNILILEDDPYVDISLRYMFLDSEYQVIKSIDSLDYLNNCLDNYKVDLFICNVFIQGNYLDKDLFLDIKRRGIPIICFTSVEGDHKYEELKDFVQGYLVKPFYKNTLLSVLKNILQQSSKSKSYDFIDKNFLYVKYKGGKLEKINFSEIIYLEAAGNYCYINTSNKRYVERISLNKMLIDKLDNRFKRVHHKYAINSEYIERVGKSEVKLTNIELPLSNSFRQTLIDFIKDNLK
ncbi:MAG: response regulator transcription factor [Leadbetterella sp.]|nr:response regulator transcription factor [Leadbetterella sp.]